MPCSRHAALMRTIHSRRNSPLRARRSRYAYCSERMACSLALRKLRLRAPEYPWAASSTARRCFLPWTERLTLAIVVILSYLVDSAPASRPPATPALRLPVYLVDSAPASRPPATPALRLPVYLVDSAPASRPPATPALRLPV